MSVLTFVILAGAVSGFLSPGGGMPALSLRMFQTTRARTPVATWPRSPTFGCWATSTSRGSRVGSIQRANSSSANLRERHPMRRNHRRKCLIDSKDRHDEPTQSRPPALRRHQPLSDVMDSSARRKAPHGCETTHGRRPGFEATKRCCWESPRRRCASPDRRPHFAIFWSRRDHRRS